MKRVGHHAKHKLLPIIRVLHSPGISRILDGSFILVGKCGAKGILASKISKACAGDDVVHAAMLTYTGRGAEKQHTPAALAPIP